MDNLYFAIDLGTTNSAIAYSNLTRNNTIKSKVVEIPRLSEMGAMISLQTLPSVVYYKIESNKMTTLVGDFAKAQYGKKYGYVAKSIKSSMGTNNIGELNNDIMDKTPQAIASNILKHLLNNAQKKLSLDNFPRDVIITVPASFDTDMCLATLEAAELAGIDVRNSDGTYKDILLYEPKAVLYDFINAQINDEIPTSIIDLTEPKNILVYDLGGGTLDVSLHKVYYDEENKEILKVDDLAISRYTKIGGDDIDEYIAENMYKHFLEQAENLKIDNRAKNQIMYTLRKKAEEFKIAISNAYESATNVSNVLSDEYDEYVSEINIYQSYDFDMSPTKRDLENFIAPLMGWNLKYDDYKRIDKLQEKDMNNIIYPILDTLAKTKQPNINIDHIILNGGMTKLYVIRDRLCKFFGKKVLTLNDPDLSVAKGASIYHYYLHKYNIDLDTVNTNKNSDTKTIDFGKNILKDTINIATKGGYVTPLAEAGTQIPFEKEISDSTFLFQKDGDSIRIPIYLGRGETTNYPNRKLAERIIRFKNKYPSGTRVGVKICVNNMNIINFKSWIINNPNDIGEIEIDNSNLNYCESNFSAKKIETLVPLNLNVSSELNNLKSLCYRQSKSKNSPQESNIAKQIEAQIAKIKNCKNKPDFAIPINLLIQQQNLDSIFYGRLLVLAKSLLGEWNERDMSVFENNCYTLLNTMYSDLQPITQNRRIAISALSTIKNPKRINLLLNILEDKKQINFHNETVVTLAKLGKYPQEILNFFLSISPNDMNRNQGAIWSVGKVASRERNICEIDILPKVLDKLIYTLEVNENEQIKGLCIYAIGEMCDSRQKIICPLSDELQKRGLQTLYNFRDINIYTTKFTKYLNKINLAISMINGIELNEDQEAQLLECRKKND